MDKPEVGQVLYSLNVGNAARNREQRLTAVTVTKVGRKYFTAVREGGWDETQYCLADWTQKTEYCADSVLCTDPQEWEDEKEARDICRDIAEAFEYRRNCRKLSLPALRRIKEIIDGGNP